MEKLSLFLIFPPFCIIHYTFVFRPNRFHPNFSVSRLGHFQQKLEYLNLVSMIPVFSVLIVFLHARLVILESNKSKTIPFPMVFAPLNAFLWLSFPPFIIMNCCFYLFLILSCFRFYLCSSDCCCGNACLGIVFNAQFLFYRQRRSCSISVAQ